MDKEHARQHSEKKNIRKVDVVIEPDSVVYKRAVVVKLRNTAILGEKVKAKKE